MIVSFIPSAMPSILTKLQKIGQRRAGAGWNKHVTPWQRRKAKKTIRRILHRLDEPSLSPPPRHPEARRLVLP